MACTWTAMFFWARAIQPATIALSLREGFNKKRPWMVRWVISTTAPGYGKDLGIRDITGIDEKKGRPRHRLAKFL